jgi:iron complex outermembrane receptor protein
VDLFSGPGGITQEMIDYISYVGVDRGYSEQYVAAANVDGPLFHLWSEEPVAASLGYEFRREEGAETPNPLVASGDSTGNKREPTAGSYDMNAVYAELVAPLVSGRPGVESLELSAAARWTSFADSTTYKLGLRYNPNDWFALRGTLTTAFRAPSIAELYQGQAEGFPNVADPCSSVRGNLDSPTVAANCAADGFDGGVPDDRVQLRSRVGGSPDLEPETAETFTLGLVLEDQLVEGLTASIDYYKIEIDRAIEAIGSGIILASCYQQEAGNRQFCDRIQRDGAGFVQTILDLDANVGGFRAEGIDFGLRYRTPGFGFGRLGAGIEGTLLLDLTQIQADGFEQSFVGNYDQAVGAAPGANPRYRLNAFLRWALDPFNAGVNFRYLPSFEECEGGPCNVNSVERPIVRTVDDYFYMDVFAGVNFLSSFGATSVTVGINNVTDATPPYIANGFLAESDAATYDYAGRSFYLRLTQQL